jgi:DNA-directed RNA polymerase specialized sigma24 family protein
MTTDTHVPGEPLAILKAGVVPRKNPVAQPTTWTLVAQARDPETADAALKALYIRFYYPVFLKVRKDVSCSAYARRMGCEPSEFAADTTQRLFMSLLDGAKLGTADKSRGKFRSWLIGCGVGQLYKDLRAESSGIRKKQDRLEAFDVDEAETRFLREPDHLSADELALRAFSFDLYRQAFEQLREEEEEKDQARFKLLERYLVEATPRRTEEYRPVAEALGVLPLTVGSAVSRLRNRLRSIVRALVEETIVSDAKNLEAELCAELTQHARLLRDTPYHLFASDMARATEVADANVHGAG